MLSAQSVNTAHLIYLLAGIILVRFPGFENKELEIEKLQQVQVPSEPDALTK
jgi:hypothetical protein